MRSTTGTAMVFWTLPSRSHVIDTVAASLLDRRSRVPHARGNLLASWACWVVLQVQWSAAMGRQASGLEVASHFQAKWLWVQDEIAALRLMVLQGAHGSEPS